MNSSLMHAFDVEVSQNESLDLFAEEGFMRGSGDASEFERAQHYAWEAQERSGDTALHIQANPTAGEF